MPLTRPSLATLISMTLAFTGYITPAHSSTLADRLANLSYEEAVAAYRDSQRDENYRCVHTLADQDYQTTPHAKTVAIEIDDVLYVKLDGQLLELAQTDLTGNSARYASQKGWWVEASYAIARKFNLSEYNESDDRHVDFSVTTLEGTWKMKTFGSRCGI